MTSQPWYEGPTEDGIRRTEPQPGDGASGLAASGDAGTPRFPRVGAVVSGRYRLDGLLKRGGMSRIYLARDQRLDQRMALKFLDVERFAGRADAAIVHSRFLREARVLGQLRHRSIVDITDAGEHDGIPFMVLRLVDGRSLGEVIKDGEQPTVRAALAVMTDVAEALAHAHAHGIVHRDLKPENIVLDENGRACVLDFGLARPSAEDSITQTGNIVGTPSFLPPELLQGERATPASDVFSAGITFYEYLTGRYPFSRDALFHSIAYQEAPRPSSVRDDVPEALDAVLLKMLAKRPEHRFRDCGELAEELARIDRLPDLWNTTLDQAESSVNGDAPCGGAPQQSIEDRDADAEQGVPLERYLAEAVRLAKSLDVAPNLRRRMVGTALRLIGEVLVGDSAGLASRTQELRELGEQLGSSDDAGIRRQRALLRTLCDAGRLASDLASWGETTPDDDDTKIERLYAELAELAELAERQVDSQQVPEPDRDAPRAAETEPLESAVRTRFARLRELQKRRADARWQRFRSRVMPTGEEAGLLDRIERTLNSREDPASTHPTATDQPR